MIFKFLVVQKDALEIPVAEGRPRLHGDLLQTAVIQNIPVVRSRARGEHVDLHAAGDHARVRRRKLQLVGDDRLTDAALQQFDLIRVHIGNAERAHLARALQFVERLRHLVRLEQRVGAVQQEQIEVVGTQPFERAVHSLDDVFLGKIVHFAGHDAAFGLQNELFARNLQRLDRPPERAFTLASTVDVRMVEKVQVRTERGGNELPLLFFLGARKPHALHRDGGEFVIAYRYIFHRHFLRYFFPYHYTAK